MRLTRHAQNAYRAPFPGGRAAHGFRPISRRFCGFLACTVLLAGSVLSSPPLTALADPADNIAYNQSLPIESNEIDNWPVGPVVSAQSAILIEATTGTVLYAKNVHAQQYPASTTKILTTLIATERCDLNELVTFSHAAVFDTPRDSNHIAIDEGQKLTVQECLEAILIRSANECAFALAEHISGTTWQDFGDIMNERATELGCVDSHFVNPNGLPDENHYTSAYDLAQIGRAFFANELLCKISTTRILHLYPTQYQPDEIIEANGMGLVQGNTYAYKYLVGCKTGYTIDARHSLVSCAEKDGLKLICVVMRDEAPYQYEDTLALYDYGFSNFELVNVSQAETKYNINADSSFYSGIDIFGSSRPILSLNQNDYVVLPKTVTFADLESTISYDTEDEKQAALITYSYHGQYLGDASVDFAINDTEGYSFEPLQSAAPAVEEEKPEEPNIIFINVVRIGKYVGIGLGAILVIVLIVLLVRRYRATHRNWRREYRREQRRRSYRLSHSFSVAQERRSAHRTARREHRRRRRMRRRRDGIYLDR